MKSLLSKCSKKNRRCSEKHIRHHIGTSHILQTSIDASYCMIDAISSLIGKALLAKAVKVIPRADAVSDDEFFQIRNRCAEIGWHSPQSSIGL